MPPSGAKLKTDLYKTEMCRSWEVAETCPYGLLCRFAHGEAELRQAPRHPNYKTQLCRAFHSTGTCDFGKRCRFAHSREEVGRARAAKSGEIRAPPASVAFLRGPRFSVFARISEPRAIGA